MKNVTIKRGLQLLGACEERIEYFSRFGKGWKKAFDRATPDDLKWLSEALEEEVEYFERFKVLIEKELDIRKEARRWGF
jgi:hypothetical protein